MRTERGGRTNTASSPCRGRWALAALLSHGRATFQLDAAAETGISQVFVVFDLHRSNSALPFDPGALIDAVIADFHGSATSGPSALYPGERAAQARADAIANGGPVDPAVWAQIGVVQADSSSQLETGSGAMRHNARMPNAANLLNDDGSASIATALLMSHHGLRRDLARFAIALGRVAGAGTSKVQALREEWQRYRSTLHGHHEAEDTQLFPHLGSEHPVLLPTIARLTADHRRIDPLLERGDRAFAELPNTHPAAEVIAELTTLLDAHLAIEEAEAVPFLRDAKQFPPPASDAEVELYAQGFAWSSHGVAPEVLTQVDAMLPDNLAARLPAARAAFEARCERVWGTARAGASRTALPDPAEI